jgi:hypothetical protein
MTGWTPQSPYLAQLLHRLDTRAVADVQAMRTIAERTLDNPKLGYHQADTPTGRFYVLTKTDLSRFIYDAGVDVWHATTWLAHDEQGKLMGDTLMPATAGPAAPRHAELGAHVWNEWTLAARPTVVAGMPVIGVRLGSAASLLDAARSIAKRLPDFQEMAAKQRMNLMAAELMQRAPAAVAPAQPIARATRRARPGRSV